MIGGRISWVSWREGWLEGQRGVQLGEEWSESRSEGLNIRELPGEAKSGGSIRRVSGGSVGG